MIRLGINIDHVATIRNARGEDHPNILKAAKFVMKNGADLITIHLREDRRHIKDIDLKILSKFKSIPINLEMAGNNKMLKIALKSNPKYVCIVPEKREELTTEGGLNLKKNNKILKKIVKTLNNKKIRTSLFINPSISNIKISKSLKTDCIEIHTGNFANLVKSKKDYSKEFKKIKDCSHLAHNLGIEVHVGHGLNFKATKILTNIKQIKEFNIGHFIIGESIFFGITKVIRNFRKIIRS